MGRIFYYEKGVLYGGEWYINSLVGLDGIAHILGMQDGVQDVTVGLPVRVNCN